MKILKKIFLCPSIIIPVILLFLFSLPFLFSDLDLLVSSLFYEKGWFFKKLAVSDWLYHLTIYPGLIFTGIFTLVFVAGFIKPNMAKYRKLSLVVILTMCLGPGLIINGILKNCVGRPRPINTKTFDGTRDFHGLFEYAGFGRGKSFPCGHASVGYVFTALFFATTAGILFRCTGLAVGIILGLLIGLMRIAQGAHFASDVIWSGGITFLCAALSHQVLGCFPSWFPDKSLIEKDQPLAKPGFAKLAIAGGVLLFSVLFLLFFALMAIPYKSNWSHTIEKSTKFKKIKFTRFPEYDIFIKQTEQIPAVNITADLKGFGFPGVTIKENIETVINNNCLEISLYFSSEQIITEKSGKVIFNINKNIPVEFKTVNKNSNIAIGDNQCPGNLNDIEVATDNGNIFLNLSRNSKIDGNIKMISASGNLKLNLSPGTKKSNQAWLLNTKNGNIQLKIWQRTGTVQIPIQMKAESVKGKLTVKAEVNPLCPVNLKYPNGNKNVEIKSKGYWLKTENNICNIANNNQGINVSLLSPQGIIILDLINGDNYNIK